MTRVPVRKLTTLGVLAALSIVLVFFIHFPIFPAAPFLEYDPADIPIFIATFTFGPAWGFLMTVAVSVIQGITVSAGSGWIGIVMHILATGSFALVAGSIYQRRRTLGGAVLSLAVGVVLMTAVMTLCNLIFTPLFMGQPMETVVAMLLPAIIPFNLLKAGINAVVTFVVYKPLGRVLQGKRMQTA